MLRLTLLATTLFFMNSAQASTDPVWIYWNRGPLLVLKDTPTDQRVSELIRKMQGTSERPGYDETSHYGDIDFDCKKNEIGVNVCFLILKPSDEVIYDEANGTVTVDSRSRNTEMFRRPEFETSPVQLRYENSCGEVFELVINRENLHIQANKGKPGCWPKSQQ